MANQIAVDSESSSDQGYAESTNTSYLSSIASSVLRGVHENGRTYASYGKTLQGIPIDEKEQDRNDLQHAKFLLLLGGKLYLAPIAEDPQKILDIGTGSGIWAIDTADMFPSASVTGVDIAPTQPTWVPPNLQFEIEDIEEDWLYRKNSFDFIFGRELLMAIRDWPRLIQQAYEHLKPGGYLELEMTYAKTCCEDGSLDLETSAYAESARLLFECGRRMKVPWDVCLEWKEQFKAAGFTDVTETTLPIPIGRWPKDKDLKKVGVFELANIDQGLDAFLLRGFTTTLQRSEDELRILTALARKEIFNPKYHLNVNFMVVYGRKPAAPASN
ncbi:S-adenosyl-L-methionine-dependent methyltransferase [Cucurbitaria berberidis CBS 394.84]|uniref:S-adenosyl-L-methionine-dependent methyltransferase n=1 Tax=Cucurbitaria berberidis CBS 394.84 TaxID=1168544 RepID=A0A9P4LC91_9PLEO|nr:S-adenosyl-L-methionine-dependent methyltransferase [Cucurbitaria berberidis CBS 394.84]KAF1850461.1 S-adenosyl-L-methionine-dependent methyltransferase [Cucurbitaria berberidis CBS 394.84]